MRDLSEALTEFNLSEFVNTFGQDLKRRYGYRVHKLAINAGFTCPNRDGSRGRGGCTFCNNQSFSPNARELPDIAKQIAKGREVIAKRTGADRFLAYFQAYTNTYADVAALDRQYRQALSEPDVVGLSIGTRPDCVPPAVLDLLTGYQDEGYEIWLELGLQSVFDTTLQRVNRGHGFAAYQMAVKAARQRELPVCAHLIAGLPGEDGSHALKSLQCVLDEGVEGIKLHPLHVVKGTMLANQWRRGEYTPMELESYIDTVVRLIAHTPESVVYHRLTGTAPKQILLAPAWCAKKWMVLNGITHRLADSGVRQGSALPGSHENRLDTPIQRARAAPTKPPRDLTLRGFID